MRATEFITEKINMDILNPEFKHEQEIGDFVYRAMYYTHRVEKPSRSKKWSPPIYLEIVCKKNNEFIGTALFKIIGSGPDAHLESEHTNVDPEYRNQGIASTMYAYAKMLGNDISPSPVQFPPGKAMWNAWEKSGDAEHLVKEEASKTTLINTRWGKSL